MSVYCSCNAWSWQCEKAPSQYLRADGIHERKSSLEMLITSGNRFAETGVFSSTRSPYSDYKIAIYSLVGVPDMGVIRLSRYYLGAEYLTLSK